MVMQPGLGKIPRSLLFPPGPGRAGVYSMRVKANSMLRLADQHIGFWSREWYRVVAGANDKMAAKVNEGVADYLDRRVLMHGRAQDERIGRWAHSEGALIESILHEDNRFANSSGFLVGRRQWLDESPAQHYWRGIEQGIGSYPSRWNALFYSSGRVYLPDPAMNREHPQMFQRQKRGRPVVVSEFEGYQYLTRGAQRAYDNIDPISYYEAAFRGAGMAPPFSITSSSGYVAQFFRQPKGS